MLHQRRKSPYLQKSPIIANPSNPKNPKKLPPLDQDFPEEEEALDEEDPYEENERLRQQLEDLKRQHLREIDQLCNEKNQTIEEYEKEREDLLEKLNGKTLDFTMTESQDMDPNDVIQGLLENEKLKNDELSKNLEEEKERIASLEEVLHEELEKNESLEKSVAKMKRQIETLQNQDKEPNQEQIQVLQKENAELIVKLEKLEKDFQKKEEENAALLKTIQTLEASLEGTNELKNTIKQLNEKLSKLESEPKSTIEKPKRVEARPIESRHSRIPAIRKSPAPSDKKMGIKPKESALTPKINKNQKPKKVKEEIENDIEESEVIEEKPQATPKRKIESPPPEEDEETNSIDEPPPREASSAQSPNRKAMVDNVSFNDSDTGQEPSSARSVGMQNRRKLLESRITFDEPEEPKVVNRPRIDLSVPELESKVEELKFEKSELERQLNKAIPKGKIMMQVMQEREGLENKLDDINKQISHYKLQLRFANQK